MMRRRTNTQQRVFPSVHAIGVSEFSKKQQAAFAYVAWFTSQEIARDYVVNGGGSSGRGSLLTDPDCVGQCARTTRLCWKGSRSTTRSRALTQWPYMWGNILGVNLNSVWTQQMSVEDGLNQMQQESNRLPQGSGRDLTS